MYGGEKSTEGGKERKTVRRVQNKKIQIYCKIKPGEKTKAIQSKERESNQSFGKKMQRPEVMIVETSE